MKSQEIFEEHNKEAHEEWEGLAQSYSNGLAQKNLPMMASLATLAKVPFSKTILEIGCGPGIGTQFLTLQAPNPSIICALDFSSSMISFCEKYFKEFTNFNYNPNNSYQILQNDSKNTKISLKDDVSKLQNGTHVKFIQGDCENLPFADEQFDSCVSSLCLHITKDYHKALKEIYRVLKKDGHFSFVVWGKENLSNFRVIEDICEKHGLIIKTKKKFNIAEAEKEVLTYCESLGFQRMRVSYSNLIRPFDNEFDFYNGNFDPDLKQQLNELEKTNPEKVKEIDLEIKTKLHSFFEIEKNVPSFNMMYVFGHK